MSETTHRSTGPTVAPEPMSLAGRMAPSDALFWYAETALPTLRPIIGGLYQLGGTPDTARVEASFDALIEGVARLRERVVEAPLNLGLPEWVNDPHFDRAYHVRRLSAPPPGGRRELLDLVAQLLATPLDRERPLWEAYVIGGLEGGRSAVFFKTHHALVDGMGSFAILEGLTQAAPEARPPETVPRQAARRASTPGPLERVASLAWGGVEESVRLAWRAAGLPWQVAWHPQETAAGLWATARGLGGLLTDLGKPAVHDPLAASTSGLSRRLDVLQVPLERFRKLKEPLGVTINDLVLAALAITLGTYHRERGVVIETLNCMVPMNLRGRDERDALGNRVGMFTIGLPVGERSPERCLERITQQTRAAKRDKRGAAYPFLMQTLTLLPGAAHRWIARQSLGRVNVACTNVLGVATTRYLGGIEVEALYPFASVVEGTPLVVALLSYRGIMQLGIDTDPEAIPDPHRIAELFEQALDEMETLPGRARSNPR